MNKKIWNIFWILLIITIIIMFLYFIIGMNTVFIGNNTRVLSIGSKIYKFRINNKILLKKVNVYKNNKVIDGFLKTRELDNENEYYLVSHNNKNIDVNDLIASGKMVMLNVIPSKNELNYINDSSLQEINDYFDTNLKPENVTAYKNLIYDIDNDSTNEQVIFISYVLNNISSDKIIIKDNNITNIVDYNYDYKYVRSKPQKVFDFVGIIDFNKDEKYEIVISRINGDSQPKYYDIYSYNNGNVKKIK